MDYDSSAEDEELSEVRSSQDESIEDNDSESDDSSVESENGSDAETDELSWCWQVVVNEAVERHEEERRELIEKLASDGATEAGARQTANEKILPIVRKELRNILAEKMEWIHEIKKDSYFQKIMNTRKDLLDTGDYGWLEATKLAIHQRKFLLNDLVSQYLEDNESEISSADDSME